MAKLKGEVLNYFSQEQAAKANGSGGASSSSSVDAASILAGLEKANIAPSSSSPKKANAPPQPPPQHSWWQTLTHIVVDIHGDNICGADGIVTKFDPMEATVATSNGEYSLCLRLAHEVNPDKCKAINKKADGKLTLQLRKVEQIAWESLERPSAPPKEEEEQEPTAAQEDVAVAMEELVKDELVRHSQDVLGLSKEGLVKHLGLKQGNESLTDDEALDRGKEILLAGLAKGSALKREEARHALQKEVLAKVAASGGDAGKINDLIKELGGALKRQEAAEAKVAKLMKESTTTSSSSSSQQPPASGDKKKKGAGTTASSSSTASSSMSLQPDERGLTTADAPPVIAETVVAPAPASACAARRGRVRRRLLSWRRLLRRRSRRR